MKKHASKILISILFIAGLSLLLYPFVANQWNNYRQKQLISNYEQVIAEKEAAGALDYDAEWEKAAKYNGALLPSILPDAFAKADALGEDKDYQACLNIAGDGIMGTVEIPKIKITLPIFHGTEDEVLEKAAGHLEGSSLPVGGENTHAVITAHRGLPSAALFTDLDKLKEGDHFLIHILKETLCYEDYHRRAGRYAGAVGGGWDGPDDTGYLYTLWCEQSSYDGARTSRAVRSGSVCG